MRIRQSLGAMAVISALLGTPAAAQSTLKIFDAHLHYNQEPTPTIRARSGARNVPPQRHRRHLCQQPAQYGHASAYRRQVAGPVGRAVHPPLSHARRCAELVERPGDLRPDRERVQARLLSRRRRVSYLRRNRAAAAGRKKPSTFAVARDLYMLAHCDEPALLDPLHQNRKGKIIWAHTGFSTPVARVSELLDQHPALMAELSYRSGITDGGGQLSPEWRELFARHADRFLLGSDTWVPERWASYDGIINGYRGWLAQLPPDQAERSPMAMPNASSTESCPIDCAIYLASCGNRRSALSRLIAAMSAADNPKSASPLMMSRLNPLG